jgi:N-hydroxyarylamine O-acetyltransferase
MLAVPFENFDIVPLQHQIQLNRQALWDKIIVRRRGGFCYELNGLFAWLLEEIGFEVTYLNGRVYNRDGKRGRNFDHLTLQVGIPNRSDRWLADVGFGDSFLEPLVFNNAKDQIQALRAYRLEHVEDGLDMLQRYYAGIWKRQYFFDLQPQKFPDDYEETCLFHQTSPLSTFTRGSVISIATGDGRITLDDNHLIVTKNGLREERLISSKEKPKLLMEYFDVIL